MNAAYNLSEDQLTDVPCPFITRYKSDEDVRFFIVDRIEDNVVTITKADKQIEKVSLAVFNNKFSGIVLAVAVTAESGENNFEAKRARELFNKAMRPIQLFLTLSMIFAIGCLVYNSGFSSSYFLGIISLKISGLFLTTILMLHEFFDPNLFNRFCNGATTNCSNVLSSGGARLLWQTISWSEVGFLYYLITTILALFARPDDLISNLIGALGISTVPFVIYSLYYQARIIRQWCTICLGIQGVILAEAILHLTTKSFHYPFNTKDIMIAILVTSIVLLAWTFLKPLFKRVNRSRVTEIRLNRFLNNEKVFAVAGTEGRIYSIPSDDISIVIGDEDAENVLTVVLSPFCDYCAEAFERVKELNADNSLIKIKIVFLNGDHKLQQHRQVVSAILALYRKADNEIIKALLMWYRIRNFNRWYKLYSSENPRIEQIEDMREMTEEQQKWCVNNDIHSSPLVFYNGYRLTDLYEINDLRWLSHQRQLP
jgi:uncharacterized membrane protein